MRAHLQPSMRSHASTRQRPRPWLHAKEVATPHVSRSFALFPRQHARVHTSASDVMEAPEALERALVEQAAAGVSSSEQLQQQQQHEQSAAGPQPINWFRQWCGTPDSVFIDASYAQLYRQLLWESTMLLRCAQACHFLHRTSPRYPLAIVQDLDARRPTPAQLLGIPIVLWRDGGGSWRAFEDRCPHRLAPLSEGRIDEDGTLMCSYHGWQFEGSGACTRIPQIADERAAATATGSVRSCVSSYPTQEMHGLVWVWPDATAEGIAAAATAPPPAVMAELDQPEDWQPRTAWFMREVPLSMETVVENVTDPCHANFTHHKVQGVRSAEKGTHIRPVGPVTPGGFKMEQDSGRFKATFEFVAPCLLKYNFPVFGRVMGVYVTPTSAGHCRMITRFIKSTHGSPRRPGLMGLVLKGMEMLEANRVLEHVLMRNKVLDGDNHVLHVQERQLLAEGAAGWQRSYYMPGTSDTGVAAWRSWLGRYGCNMPLLPRRLEDLPPLMPRRQSLDRLKQHTQHCSDCSKALQRVELALPVTWAAAVAAALLAAVSAAAGAPLVSVRVLGAAAAAAALAALHRGLVWFKSLFIFTDYCHADVH